MQKIIFLLSVIVLSSCVSHTNNENQVVVAPATVPSDTIVANGKDTIKIKALLSDAEMKDDSVFTDGSIPASWANAGITDVKGLKLFIKKIQQWIIANDRAQVAAAVKYPLKNFTNAQELLGAYDSLFTVEVRNAIMMTNFSQLFRNHDGVMLGDGKVWINQFGKEFKIFAIN